MSFPPTIDAALARLAAVRPAHYQRSRNSLDGAVSRLSPYVTHGFVTLPQILASVLAANGLSVQHKFVYELGWREYFRHVWKARGEEIFSALHAGVLPDTCYAAQVPPDVREARCGVPAIDAAVRTLYATGYLHNHARMWLASYLVHLRKVSWRPAADWLYTHLLDGDLASNHLSWQWVAGTGSHKPYLFNAENVARYAPPDWHSSGTVIDTTYAVLDALARSPDAAPAQNADVAAMTSALARRAGLVEPAALAVPPAAANLVLPDAARIVGRDVWLVHPWALREPPSTTPPDAASPHAAPPGTLALGVSFAEFHRRWPWSAARWNFVSARMNTLTTMSWFGDVQTIARALAQARSVTSVADPHVDMDALPGVNWRPAAALFAPVERPCSSFSQWWSRVTLGLEDAVELPGLR